MPTAQIKDEKTYQNLREKGESKEVSPDRQRGSRQLRHPGRPLRRASGTAA